MLPPELANPFEKPPAVPLNPDTAGFVEDMLGKEARKAFEALDEEPKKPREKPAEPTEQEKAAMRKAEKGLVERSRERFPTWKTISLGEYKTVEEFISALKEGGYYISESARQILEKIHPLSSSSSVELVNVSIEDLGFEGSATTEEIYDRAKELGLSLCPAEVGPALRLHYLEQPVNESLYVAMEPIAEASGALRIFGVFGGVLWLDTVNGNPGALRNPGIRLVFVRSKQK